MYEKFFLTNSIFLWKYCNQIKYEICIKLVKCLNKLDISIVRFISYQKKIDKLKT